MNLLTPLTLTEVDEEEEEEEDCQTFPFREAGETPLKREKHVIRRYSTVLLTVQHTVDV